MNLVALIWENDKLIVKLYLNILQNDLLKNIYLQKTHSYSSHKNHSAACSLKVGDVVHIKEDIIPRLSYKSGVVDQLITGHDGAVRGAVIRAKSKNTKETTFAGWKVPKYGVFSGRYFPIFGLNRRDIKYLSVFSPNAEKYGP